MAQYGFVASDDISSAAKLKLDANRNCYLQTKCLASARLREYDILVCICFHNLACRSTPLTINFKVMLSHSGVIIP